MNARELTILVTGATGTQGGAVARELLKKGHHVRALTRRPQSPAAKALEQLGAEVVRGDFGEPESLKPALSRIDSVFAMGTPESGVETEIRQQQTLAELAFATGVRHYLYSSAAGARSGSGVPHFESKRRVEEHIEELGLTHTIVAPVYFMENLLTDGLEDLRSERIKRAMPARRELQRIAIGDLARFCVLALENPERFSHRRIEIASDVVSGEEEADILSRVIGREIRYHEESLEELANFDQDSCRMLEWFNRTGYDVDLHGLHSEFPEVGWHSFERWAARQPWQQLLRGAA